MVCLQKADLTTEIFSVVGNIFNQWFLISSCADQTNWRLHTYPWVTQDLSIVLLDLSKAHDKQRVLMHGHQGWNVRHGLCHIYMKYVYIWVVYSIFCCCLFITVTWWYVWCIEWASGDQEEVQACLVTLWLFIISCYSLYKTITNPHFHKYSMDFHV